DVSDMCFAVEWDQVVLAHRIKFDVFDQDQFFMRNVEGGAKNVGWVLVQSGKELAVCSGNSGRGIDQTVTVWVLPHSQQNLTNRRFDSGLVHHLVLLVVTA